MKSWSAPEVPALPGNGAVPVIWDTPSGGLRVAAAGPDATLYACGITPYDATHIGHAATYLAWDLLVRAWRDAGMTVRYVQNVTDVDDPLLERAARDGEDWVQLAAREIARYRSDMAALRVVPPDHLVGAVEALPLITDFSQLLADRGALYDLDGDTYFARAADPLFGSVSGLDLATMAELSAERGGDPARAGKKDPLDPLVWRAERPGEPAWSSPFGRGRPGWHVECSAIATRYLGTVFDVQAGGRDLIFPHHEMSASQARIALAETGPPETGPAGTGPAGTAPGVVPPGGPARTAFARRYAHAGMVRLGGRKMSKSLGNLVFVSSLREAGTDPMAIRLAILAHHYRQDWDWDDQVLAAAAQRLARWRAAIATAGGRKASAARSPGERGARSDGEGAARSHGAPDRATAAVLGALRERLAADLDAPGALAVVDGWANAVLAQRAAPDPDGSRPPVSAVEAGLAQAAVVRAAVDALLGVAL